MPRIIILFLLTLTVIFSDVSEESEEFPFLGITISSQSVDLENIDEQSTATFGIRYGQQTVDWRTIFTYEFSSGGPQMFSIEIDRILMDSIYNMSRFRPYIGLSLGMIRYDMPNDEDSTGVIIDHDTNTTTHISNDSSGWFYGANAGVIIYATDNFDADVNYHYYKVEDFVGLTSTQGFGLGLHYFF